MKYDELISRAFDLRGDLFSLPDTDCFRLFNSAGDGIDGLTVDRYGEYLLVQLFEGALFEAAAPIYAAILGAASRLRLAMAGFLVKDRTIRSGNLDYGDIRRSTLLEGQLPPAGFTVVQNGIRAAVDLVEGQSTGIFLDMREIRSDLASLYPPGGSILNLFAYTGLFSVHALKNGMKRSVNVDLSRAVLQRAMENYRLNGLACDDRDFIFGDALGWMKRLHRRGDVFSFIVFDPPTFSRNRKSVFSVKHDYTRSLELAGSLCDRYLLTSINSYSVSKKEYLSYHPSSWEMVFFRNESSDFRGADRYLKAALWSIRR